MPTIISIKLNVAERNVNRIAPNTSIAIAMTRIQRSGFDALEFMSRPPPLLLLLLLLARYLHWDCYRRQHQCCDCSNSPSPLKF
jgi:hypothetical protein